MRKSHKELSRREQSMAENEVFYREQNEIIQKGLDKVNAIAKEHGAKQINFNSHQPLHFHCECANEHCESSVKLSLYMYNKIHQERDVFVIARNHAISSIEEVTVKRPDYEVVRKAVMPPAHVTKLQSTGLDTNPA